MQGAIQVLSALLYTQAISKMTVSTYAVSMSLATRRAAQHTKTIIIEMTGS